MWTSPVPIPSRIPSTPWKTDTRTAGSGLPSSFPSCPHSAVRTTPAPCVTFNRSIPAGCSFFCPPLHTSPHGEGNADRTGPPKAENAHKIRQRPAFLPLPFAQGRALSCGCTIFSRKRACRTAPFRLPPPGSPILPLRPRPSGLRPLSPRAKISFCPCPAAGTGAPARPRASASTVPAGDAVQTLPRIIP